MPMTPNDPIRGACRGDPATIKAWLQAQGAQAGYDLFVDEMYRVCRDPTVGIDAWLMVAECSEETDQFRSPYWVNDGNPSGIGIYADNVPSPFHIPGQPALSAHIHACVMLAHLGVDPAQVLIVADALDVPGVRDKVNGTLAFALHDTGFKAALPNGVRVLKDLCVPFHSSITGDDECVHACDNAYAVTICERGDAMDPNGANVTPAPAPGPAPTPAPTPAPVPGPPVRGHVPRPPMMQHYGAGNNHVIGQGRSADAARQGHINGTCVHTSEGYFTGNMEAFDTPTWGGLTDAQVGGPWDGVYNGVLMEFIDPASQVVPWANGGIGTAVPPHGDGPAYLAKFGATDYAVNGQLRSIETTDRGDVTVVKGDPQIESLCFYLAYVHAEEAKQTPETFAWRMSHWEFGGDHQQCPGDWIKAHEQQINARAVAIIRAYQTNTALTPPLVVTYPPGWKGGTIPQPGQGVTPPNPVPTPGPLPPPPPPSPVPATDPAAAFGSARFGATTYTYDPQGTVSQLWLAKAKRAGAYPRLLAVAESPNASGGTARFFVFQTGWVAVTPQDGAPAAWLGQAA